MITDTNGEMFPEGTYLFRVADIPVEVDIKGYRAWQWSFDVEGVEGLMTYNERFMVWLLAPLFRGLGFPEITPGKFKWEATEAMDRTLTATIKHVTLEKGNSAGKVVARMTDIRPSALYAAPPAYRAAMAAQAPANKDEDIPF